MRSVGAGFVIVVAGITACGGRAAKPAEEWQYCPDVGLALSAKVDECLPEVQRHEELAFIDKPNKFFELWEEFKLCEVFAGGPRMAVSAETMEQLRECGGWLINHTCQEVGQKLKEILVDKKKKVGQPPACDPLLQQIRDTFSSS